MAIPNAGMLARAQSLAEDLEIEWLESDVTATRFSDNSFDALLSQHGYHYFPQKAAALREFRRILKPGGQLAFSIWDGHSAYTQAICEGVERFISPEIAQKQRSQRETPSANTLRAALEAAQFRDVRIVRQELMIKTPLAAEFVPQHLESMPIASAFHALPNAIKTELINHVATRLAAHTKGESIFYPDAVHVAIGYK